jgi:hypothetical protein
MDVCCECFVLSGRGLCDELIIRPEESLPTVVRRCACSRNLVNEDAMAQWGLLRQKRENWRGGGSIVQFSSYEVSREPVLHGVSRVPSCRDFVKPTSMVNLLRPLYVHFPVKPNNCFKTLAGCGAMYTNDTDTVTSYTMPLSTLCVTD